MKLALMMLACNLVSLAAVIGAIVLAKDGINGQSKAAQKMKSYRARKAQALKLQRMINHD